MYLIFYDENRSICDVLRLTTELTLHLLRIENKIRCVTFSVVVFYYSLCFFYFFFLSFFCPQSCY